MRRFGIQGLKRRTQKILDNLNCFDATKNSRLVVDDYVFEPRNNKQVPCELFYFASCVVSFSGRLFASLSACVSLLQSTAAVSVG